MVEVFKTNVTSNHQSRTLVDLIQGQFKDYKVNFDLDDCDRILRIESSQEIDPQPLIELLGEMGVMAEVLQDEPFLLIIS
jgi:hypothetical protein